MLRVRRSCGNVGEGHPEEGKMADSQLTTPTKPAPRPIWVRPDFEQFETAPEVTDPAMRLP